MKFKAVCTDIDGTLLNARKQLSERTKAVFESLPSTVPVILASSRMPSAMRHLQEELGALHHPLICYNGGYVIHYSGNTQREEIHSVEIPIAVVKDITSLAAGSFHISLFHKDEWFVQSWDYWAEREATITKVTPEIAPAQRVIENWAGQGKGAHKVMCMGSESEISEMESTLLQNFGRDIHVYRSRPDYLELAPASISKGTALALLLTKRFDFGMEHVISFGDNYNDIELLKLSGLGVAVKNSRAEVLAVADEVTLNSKEDGVAVALQKYFSFPDSNI